MPDKSKLEYDEFCILAIEKLRTGNYKGIHTVYSGFNTMFQEYYGESAIPVVNGLVQDGLLAMRPVKGGVMIYKPGEGGGTTAPSVQVNLAKMGLV